MSKKEKNKNLSMMHTYKTKKHLYVDLNDLIKWISNLGEPYSDGLFKRQDLIEGLSLFKIDAEDNHNGR